MPQRIEVPGMGVVEFPDGMSDEAIASAIKANMPANVKPLTRGEKVVQGAIDPIAGGAQLLTKLLPDGVVKAGNRLNNWLADTTGMVARLPEGGVDQQVREAESLYQQRRAAGGEQGLDGYRLLGNVVSPANLAIAARAPAAATLMGRVAVGAGSGGLSALLNPVTTDGDYAAEKLKQVGVGAATGGALPVVTNALGRLISPKASTNPQVQSLRAEGVRPTIGQTLGGIPNAIEEKAASLPVVGDMISRARRGAAQDLNVAAFNRALKPIGKELPEELAGREAVEFTEDAISQGYESLLPKLTTKADQTFNAEVQNLRKMVNTGSLDPNAAKAFNRILQNDVLGKFKGQQAITGDTLKAIESDLGSQIRRFSASQDADQRLVADALQEVQSSLRGLLERTNPKNAGELKALNTAWANFKRVQRAASMVGAEDGVFSPAQLQSAVKALDRSKDKGAFARGNALMQDLSDPAKSVLGNKVPNSGTADRLFLSGGAGLAALLDPSGVAPFLLGGGAVAYSRPVQNVLAASVSRRPELAQPVANALQQATPALAPAAAQMGLQLRK